MCPSSKSLVRQLCFDAHRANIDAFVYATAIQQKVLLSGSAFSLANYQHELPLPAPRVVFIPKDDMPKDIREKMMSALEMFDVGTHAVSKQTTAATLGSPSFNIVREKLIHAAKPGITSLDNHCTVEAAAASEIIYKAISRFLATNSYPFARSKQVDGVDLE